MERESQLQFLLALPILAGLYATSLYSYLLFHGLVETFSIAVAWTIFFIAWNTRRFQTSGYLALLGVSYLFVGLIDLLHVLSYKGMGAIFPGYGADLAIEFWIGARYLEALSLLAVTFFFKRSLPAVPLLAGYTLVTGLLILSIFTGVFPVCFVDGVGLTEFKKVSEYVISAILLASLVLLCSRRSQLEPRIFTLLAISLGLTICGEVVFTLYSTMFSWLNILGHFFKLISFYLIYKAIVEKGLTRPYDLLFRDLKQSEQSLKQSYEDLTRAQRVGRVGSWSLNPVSGKVTWSDEMFRLFALNSAGGEPTYEGWLRLFRETDGALFQEVLNKTMGMGEAGKTGEGFEVEVEAVSAREGGETLHLLAAGETRSLPDGGLEVHGVMHDITARKKAEQLREDVERVMRHDLKSPPNAILGLPQVMAGDANLTPEQQENLEVISGSGYRMLNLINLSLDLYKMETGSYALKPEQVDLTGLMKNLVHELEFKARRKDIEVEVYINGESLAQAGPLLMRGEELLSYSMFSNVLNNAVEASPYGGGGRRPGG
jgi:signal transduction histidine kinase